MNDLLKAAYKGIKRDYFGRMATWDDSILEDHEYPNVPTDKGTQASPPLFLRDPKEIAE